MTVGIHLNQQLTGKWQSARVQALTVTCWVPMSKGSSWCFLPLVQRCRLIGFWQFWLVIHMDYSRFMMDYMIILYALRHVRILGGDLVERFSASQKTSDITMGVCSLPNGHWLIQVAWHTAGIMPIKSDVATTMVGLIQDMADMASPANSSYYQNHTNI